MSNNDLEGLETPCVLVDYDRLQANMRMMQEKANNKLVSLRPHIKTHKCIEIARMQIKEGAVGITAAKTDEALVFINSGVKSVTIAYPTLNPAKLDRLFKAAITKGTELRMVVDSIEGINSLSQACDKNRLAIFVFLKIDVGLHRCGIQENDPNLITLVHKLVDDPHLTFAGILSHAGHAYGKSNSKEIDKVSHEEWSIMQRVRKQIERGGHQVLEVSVGATPTALVSKYYEGITEIRPGNYVFMDLTPVRQGLISKDRVALSVLTTVVSSNNDYHIVDAGSKTLSSDIGAHGLVQSSGYGIAFKLKNFDSCSNPLTVVKLSEEHGFVKRDNGNIQIGERIRILPNHACPVSNLAKEFVVVSKGSVINRWPVNARGCVR
jgi:D-serine deaminase-like pyridoxal phosphate-dependent protein